MTTPVLNQIIKYPTASPLSSNTSFSETESGALNRQPSNTDNQTRFAVFYVDKHADPVQSQWITSAMSQCFKLQPQHRMKLSSGESIMIRSALSLEQANKMKQAIVQLGGCSWIQALDHNGLTRERRSTDRRTSFDRRALGRTDSSTDRRGRKDIRQSYIL